MKVLVCGGRNFDEADLLCSVLDRLYTQFPALEVVTGAARGADDLALKWARSKEVPFHGYPAQWNKHGKAAGPIRNSEMLAKERPDMVVAFTGGRGTQDMIVKAKAAGVPVLDLRDSLV